tara:strand:- start:422 stop:739 length:318 start_codon:yes stop_codon:yes gene_type:complete
MHKVIGTETYNDEISKWSKADRAQADRLPEKLAENPIQGDSCGYPFLREKRIDGHRVYFLIYDDLELVLLVATSGKKDQQATIDYLKKQLDSFRLVAEDVAKQVA